MRKVLTNNPRVHQQLSACESEHLCKDYDTVEDLLLAARDLVHTGWRLINHPLATSIKPNETPYKTLVLVKTKTYLDYQSLKALEAALAAQKKFGAFPGASTQVLADLQLLDLELFNNIITHKWEE